MKAKTPTTKSATKRGSKRLKPPTKSTKRGGQDNRHYNDFIPDFGVQGAADAFADAISAEWKRQTGVEFSGKVMALKGEKSVEENVAILLQRHTPGAIGDRLPGLDAKTINLIQEMQAFGWVFQLEDRFHNGQMDVIGHLEEKWITKNLTISQVEDYAERGVSIEEVNSYAGYNYNARCREAVDEAMNAVFDASQLLEYYVLKDAGMDFVANRCEFDTKKATAILEKVLKWARGK